MPIQSLKIEHSSSSKERMNIMRNKSIVELSQEVDNAYQHYLQGIDRILLLESVSQKMKNYFKANKQYLELWSAKWLARRGRFSLLPQERNNVHERFVFFLECKLQPKNVAFTGLIEDTFDKYWNDGIVLSNEDRETLQYFSNSFNGCIDRVQSIVDQSKATKDWRLEILARVQQAEEDFRSILLKYKHPIFHTETGKAAAAWVSTLLRIQTEEELFREIGNYLSDDAHGKIDHCSFRTILLHNLLSDTDPRFDTLIETSKLFKSGLQYWNQKVAKITPEPVVLSQSQEQKL